jgi:hypothetical protein
MKLKNILLYSLVLTSFSCNGSQKQILLPNAEVLTTLLEGLSIYNPLNQKPFIDELANKNLSAPEIAQKVELLIRNDTTSLFGNHFEWATTQSTAFRKEKLLTWLLESHPESLQALKDQGMYDGTYAECREFCRCTIS